MKKCTETGEMKLADVIKGIQRVKKFVLEDVWDIELSGQSTLRSLGIKTVRVLFLVFKGFKEDDCPLHASALTFFTMMAIVPVLALSLAFADSIGGADAAKRKIQDGIADWTEQFNSVSAGTNQVAAVNSEVSADILAKNINEGAEWVFNKAESINFATIGGIGLAILIMMVVKVLGNVESSFNRVWGVRKGRPMWRRFADYMIVLVGLVIITSPSVANIVTRGINKAGMPEVQAFLGTGALKDMTNIILTIICFTLLIKLMPNTRVKVGPALTGGTVGGVSFLVWMKICSWTQIGVAKYGMVYGSFAVVPIVLAWVLVSWCIVLFAAEVAFAVQNVTTYRMEQGASRASAHSRVILALSVVVEAARGMSGKGEKFEVAAYARDHRVSVRFLNDIVDELVEAGFLGSLSEDEGCFVLLKTPDSMKLKDVIDAILTFGVKPVDLGLASLDPKIESMVESAFGNVDASVHGTSIQDIVKG